MHHFSVRLGRLTRLRVSFQATSLQPIPFLGYPTSALPSDSRGMTDKKRGCGSVLGPLPGHLIHVSKDLPIRLEHISRLFSPFFKQLRIILQL
jgi:hypothetical protein